MLFIWLTLAQITCFFFLYLWTLRPVRCSIVLSPSSIFKWALKATMFFLQRLVLLMQHCFLIYWLIEYSIFKWSFLNENGKITFEISLKFVHDCPIDNEPALVQIMAWRLYLNQCWSDSRYCVCGCLCQWSVLLYQDVWTADADIFNTLPQTNHRSFTAVNVFLWTCFQQ